MSEKPLNRPFSVTRLEAEQRLLSFSKSRVLVVGDVGLDQYTQGTVDRISPEAPVPIVSIDRPDFFKLGLAGNVAENISALGGEALLIGILGADVAAERVRQLIRERGAGRMVCHCLEDAGRPTIVKQRVVTETQQLLRIDQESRAPLSEKLQRQLLETLETSLGSVDAIVLEDYAKGMVQKEWMVSFFDKAARAGKKVFVDPNRQTPLADYRGAFLLTPNTQEAEALTGRSLKTSEDFVEAGRILLQETGASYALITRGKLGMALFSQTEDPLWIPTFAREVYDVSGAGDTVVAFVALAMASGEGVREAVFLANVAAGVKVGKRGTAVVSREEVLAAL